MNYLSTLELLHLIRCIAGRDMMHSDGGGIV
jgi:hypothetical protein